MTTLQWALLIAIYLVTNFFSYVMGYGKGIDDTESRYYEQFDQDDKE